MIKFVLFLLPAFLVMMPASAQSSSSYQLCIDNTTLNVSNVQVRCINDVCKDFSQWETSFCPNGCDLENNVCNPQGFSAIAIVSIFIAIFIVVLVVFLKVVK